MDEAEYGVAHIIRHTGRQKYMEPGFESKVFPRRNRGVTIGYKYQAKKGVRRPQSTYRGARLNEQRSNSTSLRLKKERKELGLTRKAYDKIRQSNSFYYKDVIGSATS